MAITASPNTSAHLEKGWFAVRMGNELEEPVRGVFVDRQISNLIDDEEGVLQAMLDDPLCPVLLCGGLELFHQHGEVYEICAASG